MQETEFIHQNKDKWNEFEQVLKSSDKDPERLTDLFIETTDDLSYSRTFYPNRSVRVYLNGISQLTYQAIYRNRGREKNALRKFWLQELPDAMWHSRRTLLYSFLLFIGGLSIGMVSSIYYPEFAQIILGDQYIAMTEANIANGDPMAVYKNQEPMIMFFQIAWNNIKIAFGTFVLGILFGIGTIYVVFFNGIMVGAFIYFFIERGLFNESFLAIMLHGTLELSMIVVAGCAGFTLARGLLFPGTFTRGQALFQSARQGIKILIGVTVLLIYAAIIESFATRYTDMPDALRAIIILLSALLVVGYFVWFPRYRHRNGYIKDHKDEVISESKSGHLHPNNIKSSAQLFSESFSLLSKNIPEIINLSIGVAVLVTLAFGFITEGKFHQLFENEFSPEYTTVGILYPWDRYGLYLNFRQHPLLYLFYTSLFAAFGIIIFRLSMKHLKKRPSINANKIINVFVIALITGLPLLAPHPITVTIMPFYFPFCLLWIYVTFESNQDAASSLMATLRLLRGNFWRMIVTFLSMISVIWICLLLISTEVVGLLIDFIQINIPRNAVLSEESGTILFTFFAFLIPAFIFSIAFFGTTLLYYSLKEINEANSLTDAINKIGFKKRAYGLEQES